MRRLTVSVANAVAILLIALPLCAATDWPKEARIGPEPGFHVVDIKPMSEKAAAGRITDVPKFQPFGINLIRDGDKISGSGKGTIQGLGLKMEAEFKIGAGGLEAEKGTITGMSRKTGKPISDAAFTISPRGLLKGSGKIKVGSLSIPCRFTIDEKTAKMEGSLAMDPVKKETALATYTFKGSLAPRFIDPDSERGIAIHASGSVERLGKLTNITDSYGPFDEPVNTGNGEVKMSVAGVEVVFDLW